MAITVGLLISLVLVVGALVVVNDWRWTIPLLLGTELCRIGLTWQTMNVVKGSTVWPLLIAQAVAALSAGLILLITALNFTKDYSAVELDEFALLELRRAALRAQHQRGLVTGRWGASIVPFGGVVLAGLATWLLSTFYPVARQQIVDAGWIFLLLCGLLILITALDVLKLGLGMLVLVASAKLLYLGVAAPQSVLHVGLLELLSLMLAVIVAYLSGLLYGRLHTLEFGSLFEQH